MPFEVNESMSLVCLVTGRDEKLAIPLLSSEATLAQSENQL